MESRLTITESASTKTATDHLAPVLELPIRSFVPLRGSGPSRVEPPKSEAPGLSTPSRSHRSRKCCWAAARSLRVLPRHFSMNCSGVICLQCRPKIKRLFGFPPIRLAADIQRCFQDQSVEGFNHRRTLDKPHHVGAEDLGDALPQHEHSWANRAH